MGYCLQIRHAILHADLWQNFFKDIKIHVDFLEGSFFFEA